MSNKVFFLGKVSSSSGRSGGSWHLFKDRDSSCSVCGTVPRTSLAQGLDLREFRVEKQEVEDVIGLGSPCSSCMEYVTGCLEEDSLPKPCNTRYKNQNLLQEWDTQQA